jgi:RecA/RadA recombinase
MSDIINSLLKEAGNEYGATIVSKGIESGDITSYVPTGSFTLNALLSGSIYGGIPGNKVYAYAGEPSTGKTFFAINAVKRFLKDNPKGFCFYFETESAITSQMLKDRGVDVERIAVMPVTTVQEFRSQALRIINTYLEKPKKDRPPMLFVLDSLGNLSTQKEMEDIAEGKETRDMTRSQLIKGAFRVLTLKMGLANVAMVCTNHVYDVIGSYVPMKKMGGGSGLDYAASGVVFLSKKKAKDDDKKTTGVILTAKLVKSRLTMEDKRVEVLLDFQKGLDPYYGLSELAESFGIFKKTKIGKSNGFILPDGTEVLERDLDANPEKYYNKALLDEIDSYCKNEFLYGKTNLVKNEEE